MWKFLVKNQSIEILEREVLADHQIQYVQFKFVFDGDWKRFHKVVQFSQCDETYNIVLGVDGTSLYLPAELHVGAAKMSVFGYDTESDTTVRATTVPVTLNIRPSGFVGDDDPPIPPTPDLYAQLLKAIEEAGKGADGKSAYEIAVEHGYVGTEEEWLESLKGKDGITPDMSEYPKTSEVTTIIEREIAPVAEESHTHDNKATLDAITPELFGELDGLQQFEDSTKYDIQTLNEALDNLRQKTHTHPNAAVLDATTAPYTTEEQQKLAGISPETYATQDALNEQILLVREAIAPLEHASHNHTNKAVLDAITAIDTHLDENSSNPVANYVLALAIDVLNTAKHTHGNAGTLEKITEQMLTAMQDFGPFEDWTREQIHTLFELVNNFSNTAHTHENKAALDAITQVMVDDLGGLQQFEDSVTQQIQTVRESVEPVVSQAHWHHNLTVLNSITQAKINEWDSIATLKTQLNALSTELTVFKGKCDNNSARIGVNETDIDSIQATLLDLQAQIDALKNNGYTVLFECGDDMPEKYGILLGFVVNGGFRTLTNMRSQFPNFCSETNDYALFYDQEDFNWDAQVLTCVEQRIKLTSDSKIQFCYNSGATEDGMLYLINPPGGKIDVPITLYARSEIEYGRAIQLDFQWLQTQKFITTETDCTGIQPGKYYLCWVGRSNNTHPIIRSVKVKEVEA